MGDGKNRIIQAVLDLVVVVVVMVKKVRKEERKKGVAVPSVGSKCGLL